LVTRKKNERNSEPVWWPLYGESKNRKNNQPMERKIKKAAVGTKNKKLLPDGLHLGEKQKIKENNN